MSINSWRKRFIKILPPWYTCLFCLGWLGNVQRFITCAEPLYDSFNPLFCDVFAAVVVCGRSLLLWSVRSHDVDLSVFCLLLYLRFKPISLWKIPSEQLSSSTLEKLPISGNSPRIFGLLVSAHGLGRVFSPDHRTTNRQGNLWSLYQDGFLT